MSLSHILTKNHGDKHKKHGDRRTHSAIIITDRLEKICKDCPTYTAGSSNVIASSMEVEMREGLPERIPKEKPDKIISLPR